MTVELSVTSGGASAPTSASRGATSESDSATPSRFGRASDCDEMARSHGPHQSMPAGPAPRGDFAVAPARYFDTVLAIASPLHDAVADRNSTSIVRAEVSPGSHAPPARAARFAASDRVVYCGIARGQRVISSKSGVPRAATSRSSSRRTDCSSSSSGASTSAGLRRPPRNEVNTTVSAAAHVARTSCSKRAIRALAAARVPARGIRSRRADDRHRTGDRRWPRPSPAHTVSPPAHPPPRGASARTSARACIGRHGQHDRACAQSGRMGSMLTRSTVTTYDPSGSRAS